MFDILIPYYRDMITHLADLNGKVELLFIIVVIMSFSNLMYFILSKRWLNK